MSALQRSHPGARIAVLTDQATQIDLPPEVRLFRFTIDRSKLGRNAYANYYQYLAQVRFCPFVRVPCFWAASFDLRSVMMQSKDCSQCSASYM